MKLETTGNRGVAYCVNEKCNDYGKGIFVLLAKTQQCPRCLKWCEIVHDRSIRDTKGFDFYRAAIVHFDYDFTERKYRKQAIVELNDAVGGGIYEYEAIVCRSDKRATQIAERLLSIVNCNQLFDLNSADPSGMGFEQVISWDEAPDKYRARLEDVKSWADERYRRINVR